MLERQDKGCSIIDFPSKYVCINTLDNKGDCKKGGSRRKKMSLILTAVHLLVLCACGAQSSSSVESIKDMTKESAVLSVEETPSAAEIQSDESVEEKAGHGAEPEAEETVESDVSPQEAAQLSAEDVLLALQEHGLPIERILVYDESTDLNGILGRPGNYIGKADFQDSRVEEPFPDDYDEFGLSGGTIEVFDNKESCKKRYDYLKSLDDASLGAVALNQYMYATDFAILRVSYDILPSEAEAYEAAFLDVWGDAVGCVSVTAGIIETSASPSEEMASSEPESSDHNDSDALSLDVLVAALDYSLSQNFGNDYSVTSEGDLIIVNVWKSGIAFGAIMAQSGDQDFIDQWNDLVDSMMTLGQAIQKTVDTMGNEKYHVMLNVLNDANKDNVLLTVFKGAVVYDIVNEIDIKQ